MRHGKAIRLWVAAFGKLFNSGAARIPRAQDTRHLIVCLARRVVARAAENGVVRIIVHPDNMAVSA